ncbi:MAG: ribonuclease, partial [Thermoleophilia bacterium]|nr:ribonuclease [Thermoleophilia bacterium]
SDNAHVHVSGHGSSAELLTLLQLVRPTTFMPVHGEWRHLRAHSALAQSVGIAESSVLLTENGSIVELKDGVARITGEFVKVGEQLVDRNSNDEIVDEVLDERQQAAADGVVVVVMHENSGTLELIARGFVEDETDGVLEKARTAAEGALDDIGDARIDEFELAQLLQQSVESSVRGTSRRSPLVVPVVLAD